MGDRESNAWSMRRRKRERMRDTKGEMSSLSGRKPLQKCLKKGQRFRSKGIESCRKANFFGPDKPHPEN